MLPISASVRRGRCPNLTLSPCWPSSFGTVLYLEHRVLLHYYNVHLVWLIHRQELYLYLNFTLLLLVTLQRSDGIRQESTVSTASTPIHRQVPSPALVGQCIFGVFVLKDGVSLSSYEFPLYVSYHTWNVQTYRNDQTGMRSKMPLTLNSDRFRNLGLVKGIGFWAFSVSDPFSYYGLVSERSSGCRSLWFYLGMQVPGRRSPRNINLKGCWAGRFTRGRTGPLAFTL